MLTSRFLNGNLVRNSRGEVIRKTVVPARGDATFPDLKYDELPPGPIRQQIRAVVVAVPPSAIDSNPQPDLPGKFTE